MVSFHCNGCTDVIKKPKLDQHYSRCKSSVDCIDCSKTFSSPAEWKSHTACVSEAEKYQKSLYKGPRTQGEPSDGFRGNSYGGRNGQGEPSDGFRGNSYGRGRVRSRGGGMPPNRGGRPGNRPFYSGTGSNNTPLGSPREFGRSPAPMTDKPAEEVQSEPPAINGTKRKAAEDEESANKKAKVEKANKGVQAVDTATTGKKSRKAEAVEAGKKEKSARKEKSDAKKVSGEEGTQAEEKAKRKEERAKAKAEKEKAKSAGMDEEGEERAKRKAAEKEEKAKRKAEEKARRKAAEKEEKATRKARRKEAVADT